MGNMIAYCGLDCEECPIHVATLELDQAKQQTMRIEIARICSQLYGMQLLPADVTDCDGCRLQSARLFSGCARCEIRKCAIDKKLASCGFCADYECEKLLKHFATDPEAHTRLDAMRLGSTRLNL
jgi:hypothetical protein